MGSTELQVFIALGVVLVAVLIALAVDILKGSNEKLRERNAALQERERAAQGRAKEAEQHYLQLIELVETLKDAEQLKPVQVSAPMASAKPPLVPDVQAEMRAKAGPLSPDARLVVETPIPEPETPVAVRVIRDEADLEEGREVEEEEPPPADLVQGLGLTMAPIGRQTRRFVAVSRLAEWGEAEEPPIPELRLKVESPEWSQLAPEGLPAEDRQEETPGSETLEEGKPVAKVVEMPRSEPPESAGGRRADLLNDLLQSEGPFEGVALSISVVDYVRLVAENGKEPVEEVMTALEELVRASGGDADLVCRISEDEFIVVCPGATGGAAAQRVRQLSESLWDFQLRSLVSFPIMFSWGASESGAAQGTPRSLADSVDRAREQMLESRRSRRALSWPSAKYGLQSGLG